MPAPAARVAGWALPCVLAALLAVQPAVARAQPQPGGFGAEDGIVTTRHETVLDGRTLRYTARAGLIPIRENETGTTRAHIFFTAYALDRPAGAPARPVTFLWNGGPGASSSLVHLLGFGPKRVQPGGSVVPNDGTLLGASDLVFVDPVGTGYSRPVRAEYGPEFYQTRGDAESIAEFIRVWLTRADAWDAPLFLAGESYGVGRAVRVADLLLRRGIDVHGVVLVGLVPPLGRTSDALRTALALPTYAAAAYHHGRLEPALQRDMAETLRQAEAWALGEYLPALERLDALHPRERAAARAGVARFSGVAPAAIDERTLALTMDRFTRELLRDRGHIVGRYDSRMTAPIDTTQRGYDPTRDPSLVGIIDNVGVLRYLRNELGFLSDLRYQGPFGGGYPPPATPRGDWMSQRWDRPAPGASPTPPVEDPDGVPALQRLLEAEPGIRALITCGYFDLVCSYALNEYHAALLEPALAGRVTVRNYPGAHAIYTDPASRRELGRDVSRFIGAVIDTR